MAQRRSPRSKTEIRNRGGAWALLEAWPHVPLKGPTKARHDKKNNKNGPLDSIQKAKSPNGNRFGNHRASSNRDGRSERARNWDDERYQVLTVAWSVEAARSQRADAPEPWKTGKKGRKSGSRVRVPGGGRICRSRSGNIRRRQAR